MADVQGTFTACYTAAERLACLTGLPAIGDDGQQNANLHGGTHPEMRLRSRDCRNRSKFAKPK